MENWYTYKDSLVDSAKAIIGRQEEGKETLDYTRDSQLLNRGVLPN